MKNPSIRLSSLGYLGIAALFYAYASYFERELYDKPYLPFNDLLLQGYILIAVPAIYFFVSSFVTVIVYTISPIIIPKACRRWFLGVTGAVLLAYAVPVFLTLFGWHLPWLNSAAMAYPAVFAVPGILLALGIHRKNQAVSKTK